MWDVLPNKHVLFNFGVFVWVICFCDSPGKAVNTADYLLQFVRTHFDGVFTLNPYDEECSTGRKALDCRQTRFFDMAKS